MLPGCFVHVPWPQFGTPSLVISVPTPVAPSIAQDFHTIPAIYELHADEHQCIVVGRITGVPLQITSPGPVERGAGAVFCAEGGATVEPRIGIETGAATETFPKHFFCATIIEKSSLRLGTKCRSSIVRGL